MTNFIDDSIGNLFANDFDISAVFSLISFFPISIDGAKFDHQFFFSFSLRKSFEFNSDLDPFVFALFSKKKAISNTPHVSHVNIFRYLFLTW